MEYRSRATRALVRLHEQRMRSFFPVWQQAARDRVVLPATDNANYQSLETLLRHVLVASRGYLTWISESLELPDPQLDEPPPLSAIAAEASGYLETLLGAWERALTSVAAEQLRAHRYPWHKLEMYVETLLEHAVVHPERHQFQLQELLEGAQS
jgi:uncharacterized damage-inducible protein DinB